jgi:hypothetical protein
VSLGWLRLAGTEQVASLKEMQNWSGYSVDRRGFYCPDGELGLWTKDPMNRPFWRVPARFEKKMSWKITYLSFFRKGYRCMAGNICSIATIL